VEGGYVLDGGALCLELLTPNVSQGFRLTWW
jgi:hypothetical protein